MAGVMCETATRRKSKPSARPRASLYLERKHRIVSGATAAPAHAAVLHGLRGGYLLLTITTHDPTSHPNAAEKPKQRPTRQHLPKLGPPLSGRASLSHYIKNPAWFSHVARAHRWVAPLTNSRPHMAARCEALPSTHLSGIQ
eukprot:scaffold201_cov121-Isochrysis_galbana.AAC.18